MQLNLDDYAKSFLVDEKNTISYFKNFEKTEQQKYLEKLISNYEINENTHIADIGCGGGKLSFYLNQLYPNAKYFLLDYNSEAINIAKNINKGQNFNFTVGNIYEMPFPSDFFDLTNCLVVVSFIENTKLAIEELIRITKKGGRIIISALINFEHDVDLLTKVLDKTRESSKYEYYLTYNTYSVSTFRDWIEPNVDKVEFYEFITEKEFIYNGKGIDTYTVNILDKKIQFAGGMKLNWGFIDIIK